MSELQTNLKEIRKHYEQIEIILDKMPSKDRHILSVAHTSGTDILFCSRWGLQATKDLTYN